MKRLAFIILALTSIFFVFTGCSIDETDELYSLPQPPEEYLQLQELIDKEILGGWEYSAPTIGSFRQSVQLSDLDGDGVNEALAFLTNKETGPKICVYRNGPKGYELAATIDGEGTSIGRVEYADLDGNGMTEILTSWKVSADMRLLKAYSVKDWTSSVLLTTSCTDFQIGDLDMNGTPDVAVLNFDQSGGAVDMFTVDKKGEILQSSAKLSTSLQSVARFRVAAISNNIPAVFVEGQYPEGDELFNLTDIFVFTEGKLKNITLEGDTQDSRAKRHYPVFCTDIDGNGSMDVPFAEKLYAQPSVSAVNYVFDWFSYDETGNSVFCGSTYHNYSDGWYFIIPDEWRNGLTVRRDTALSGERTVVISHVDQETDKVTDILTIYVLSDENRVDRAKISGRFVLVSSETVIYAARLSMEEGETPTEEQQKDIINRFHLIYTEWITGAV